MAKRDFGARNQPGLGDHRQALAQCLDTLPPVTAVWGEADFLRAEAVAEYRRAWLERYPGGDIVVLRGAGEARPVGIADIVAELSGGSLFGNDKLVLVRQAEKVLFPGRDGAPEPAADKAVEREARLLAQLEKPSGRIWLVLETRSLPKNRTLGKKIAAVSFSVPCPPPQPREIPAWLRTRLEGRSITPEAVELLLAAHGPDLGVLAGEADKLVLRAGDGDRIDADMVREFLTGRVELDVFGYTNAIEERNLRQALYYARRITLHGTRDQKGKKEDGRRSSEKILALLANTVTGLYRAGAALAAGKSAAEFATEDRIASPWRAGKLMDAAGNFRPGELGAMTGFLADQMRQVHDTGGDPLLALELLAVKFAGGARGRASRRDG